MYKEADTTVAPNSFEMCAYIVTGIWENCYRNEQSKQNQITFLEGRFLKDIQESKEES